MFEGKRMWNSQSKLEEEEGHTFDMVEGASLDSIQVQMTAVVESSAHSKNY